MILATALLLAAPAAALTLSLPESEPESEIVVLGNLRSVTVNVGQDRQGQWHCSMNRSTGRASLDHAFCKAVTKCVRADFKDGTSDQAAVESCVRDTRGQLVRRFERSMKRKNS